MVKCLLENMVFPGTVQTRKKAGIKAGIYKIKEVNNLITMRLTGH